MLSIFSFLKSKSNKQSITISRESKSLSNYLSIELVLILILSTSIGATYFSYTKGIKENSSQYDEISDANNHNNFTYAEIERLKLEMYLFQVEAILGRGVKIEQSTNSKTYQWYNSNGAWLICKFDNKGQLLSFQQKGFK